MSGHVRRNLSIPKNPSLPAAAWIAITPILLILITQPLLAQTAPAQTPPPPAWQTAAGTKQTFDVASVRPSPPGSRPRGAILNPFDETPPTGGLFSANGPLIAYIAFAYKLRDITQMMALNGKLPEWAQAANTYDIEARADGAPTQDQVRLMVQSLLAERFKLAVHYETKQLPVFALALDKPGKLGPQFVPHPAEQPCLNKPEKAAPLAPNTAPPIYCGIDEWQVNGLLHVRMIDVTMEQATGLLGGMGGILGDLGPRSAIDQTGLTGHYDLNLEFVMQKAGDPSASPDSDSGASGPSITTALKNQLGLKLIKQTGPVNVFVLDHIEKPSEN
jgi:uncharacterized protein (TIGR03435 family)